MGKQWKQSKTIFLGSKITADGDCSHEIKRCLLLGGKAWQHIKKQRHYFANKSLSSQSYGFPSSHVWMWELDHKEGWALKNGYFWTMVLEKTPESPLDNKEIQPVHPKGNQSWIFIGRTDAEAETPILWLSDAKNWLIGKDHDAGKDWRWEEKGMTGWDGWMASLTQWTWVWASSWKLVKDREAWCAAVHGATKSQTWVSNGTETEMWLLLAEQRPGSLSTRPKLMLSPMGFYWKQGYSFPSSSLDKPKDRDSINLGHNNVGSKRAYVVPITVLY